MAEKEAIAREYIDTLLTNADWAVQDVDSANISSHFGVAIREMSLTGFSEKMKTFALTEILYANA